MIAGEYQARLNHPTNYGAVSRNSVRAALGLPTYDGELGSRTRVSLAGAVAVMPAPPRGLDWATEYTGSGLFRVALVSRRTGAPVFSSVGMVQDARASSVEAMARVCLRRHAVATEDRKLHAGGRVRHFLKGHKITRRTIKFRTLPRVDVLECDCGKVWRVPK